MLPLALFRRPGFSAANGAGFALHFTMFGAFFIVIQYLTQVHGDSAIRAGVETLPWTLLPLVALALHRRRSAAASAAGRSSSPACSCSPRAPLAAAFAMGVGSSYAELVAPLVAIGVGIALVLPNVASAALGSALPEHIGKASGANSTFRQLGGVFGIAVAVLVFDRAGSYASAARRRRRRAGRALRRLGRGGPGRGRRARHPAQCARPPRSRGRRPPLS